MPTQSSFQASLMPSHNTHTLFGVFFSHLLFRLLSKFPRKQFSLFLSDVRTRTLVRTESKQSKEGRHPLSLSLLRTPITDESRAFTVSKRNRIAHHFHTRRRSIFSSEPIGRTVSLSLSHSLRAKYLSLSLYIEVFSKDELQLSHQSVMGGQPVSRRGHEKLLFFSTVNNRTIGKCLSVFHDRVESAVSKRVRFPSITHSCSSKIIAWG